MESSTSFSHPWPVLHQMVINHYTSKTINTFPFSFLSSLLNNSTPEVVFFFHMHLIFYSSNYLCGLQNARQVSEWCSKTECGKTELWERSNQCKIKWFKYWTARLRDPWEQKPSLMYLCSIWNIAVPHKWCINGCTIIGAQNVPHYWKANWELFLCCYF